jgi:HSP20 family protein
MKCLVELQSNMELIRNRCTSKEGVTYLDSYSIACPVDPEQATAKYSNGVLKVTVPYQQPLKQLFDVKIE